MQTILHSLVCKKYVQFYSKLYIHIHAKIECTVICKYCTKMLQLCAKLYIQLYANIIYIYIYSICMYVCVYIYIYIYIYTLPLKSLGSVRFLMFLRESLLLKAVFIQSKIQHKTVILRNLIAISNIGFLF